jgi:hypothetical protein
MHAIQGLAKPNKIIEVLLVARSSPILCIRDIRWTRHGTESDPIIADLEVMLRISCMKRVSARCFSDLFLDQATIEANPVRAWFDVGASFAKDVMSAWVEKIHPYLFEDGQRSILDFDQAFLVQDFDGREWILNLAPWALVDLIRPFPTRATAPPRPCHQFLPLNANMQPVLAVVALSSKERAVAACQQQVVA